MSIDRFVKENVKGVGDKVYITPDIPEKKLNNAIGNIATGENPDYVIAVADSTLFGSAKDGVVFTGEKMYIRGLGETPLTVHYSTISTVQYKVERIKKDDGSYKEKQSVTILYKDNTSKDITLSLSGLNYEAFANFVNDMLDEAESVEDFKNTTQTCPLSDLPTEIKENYIKIMCNFCFSDDARIDSNEYTELLYLMVRIETNKESRLKLRGYMLDSANIEDNGKLLVDIYNLLVAEGYGNDVFDILKTSMIKDLIYLLRKKSKEASWKNNNYIVSLNEILGVNEDQIDLIVSSIISDESIISERKNDDEIKKSVVELASKAAAVGLPLAAVYFSGSVIGVSAVGLTSGLAALGMGGVLGFSSMFTGIGVVALLGVGAYKGVKKFSGVEETERNKQREMMLETIMKNSNKALKYLIEDVGYITDKFIETVKSKEQDQAKIDKLTGIIGMLTRSSKEASDKIDFASKEQAITRLPAKLDINQLNELNNGATKEKAIEFIKSCYLEKTVEKNGTERTVYVLDDTRSIEDLEGLRTLLESVGYFNAQAAGIAKAKGLVKGVLG